MLSIYQYEPQIRFLAATMDKPRLHAMQDPLARANVMSYRDGEALNWHFDRSEFTTTLLLQAAEQGGDFEYRTDLRSDDDPNYEGVARLLEGRDPQSKIMRVKPGTLNVFRGKNTAHRVTTVRGNRDRMIAVFSYYGGRASCSAPKSASASTAGRPDQGPGVRLDFAEPSALPLFGLHRSDGPHHFQPLAKSGVSHRRPREPATHELSVQQTVTSR